MTKRLNYKIVINSEFLSVINVAKKCFINFGCFTRDPSRETFFAQTPADAVKLVMWKFTAISLTICPHHFGGFIEYSCVVFKTGSTITTSSYQIFHFNFSITVFYNECTTICKCFCHVMIVGKVVVCSLIETMFCLGNGWKRLLFQA